VRNRLEEGSKAGYRECWSWLWQYTFEDMQGRRHCRGNRGLERRLDENLAGHNQFTSRFIANDECDGRRLLNRRVESRFGRGEKGPQ
jgi:hypothetical protein